MIGNLHQSGAALADRSHQIPQALDELVERPRQLAGFIAAALLETQAQLAAPGLDADRQARQPTNLPRQQMPQHDGQHQQRQQTDDHRGVEEMINAGHGFGQRISDHQRPIVRCLADMHRLQHIAPTIAFETVGLTGLDRVPGRGRQFIGRLAQALGIGMAGVQAIAGNQRAVTLVRINGR
ncbi:hypothetical protein D3C76_1132220 [compost metagenome]